MIRNEWPGPDLAVPVMDDGAASKLRLVGDSFLLGATVAALICTLIVIGAYVSLHHDEPHAFQEVTLHQNDGDRCCDAPRQSVTFDPHEDAFFTLLCYSEGPPAAELRLTGARTAGPFKVEYDEDNGAFSLMVPGGYLKEGANYSFSADRPGTKIPHIARWDFRVPKEER